jgi:MFS family permease
VAIGALMMMVASHGVGFYGPAVLLKPLRDEHGWSNTAVSGATGLYFAVSGLTAAFIGPMIDRHGPVLFMVIGGVVMSGAFALIGVVETLWQLYLVYALVAAVWGAFALVTVNVLLTRWFTRRRAAALGTAFCGVSIGGMLVGPSSRALLDAGGVELAALVLGAAVLVIAVPIAVLVFAEQPRVLGLEPDGDPPPAEPPSRLEAPRHAAPHPSSAPARWSARTLMRSVPFWLVLSAFVLVLMAQTGFLMHELSFFEQRFDKATAAWALTLTAFGTIVARVVLGPVLDRLNRVRVAVVIVALQVSVLFALLAYESKGINYLAALLFGFTVGNVYLLQALLVADIFGAVTFATVFSLVNMATSIASGVGPFLVGGIEQQTSYAVAFVTIAALNIVAVGILIALHTAHSPTAVHRPERPLLTASRNI